MTPLHIRQMQVDFARLLASPEASDFRAIILTMQGAVLDAVFGMVDATSGVASAVMTGRCIQQIVKPRDKQILEWGILEVGDCILYLSNDMDLTLTENQSIYFVDPSNVEWTPVPVTVKGFENYLYTRLGNSQLGQVIACTLKK